MYDTKDDNDNAEDFESELEEWERTKDIIEKEILKVNSVEYRSEDIGTKQKNRLEKSKLMCLRTSISNSILNTNMKRKTFGNKIKNF